MKIFLALTAVMFFAFIVTSRLYTQALESKKQAWEMLSLERRKRAQAEDQIGAAEMQHEKLEQSYINLLEVISSPGEENRIHFFKSLFAYNLLSYGQQGKKFRCNPPKKILGVVANGVQGSSITLKTETNEYREVFILAVVE